MADFFLPPSVRFNIEPPVIVIDDSGKTLPWIASALVSYGRFQNEPLIFLRGRSLVRVVRSPLPYGGVLIEPVPVSLGWLRHVAIPTVAMLHWSDGRAVQALPEVLARKFIADAAALDFWPALYVHGKPVTETAKLAALADAGEGWHLFHDALVELRHPAPLRVVDGSLEAKRRRTLVERAVRLHGGWLHKRWLVDDPRERNSGEQKAAVDRMGKDLRLVRSETAVEKTLTRIASTKAARVVGGFRNPYSSPVVADLRRLGLFDHPVALRVNVARRGVRPQLALLMPYDHVVDCLLGAEFHDTLAHHGLACRLIASPPWDPACVGFLFFSENDGLALSLVEGSPGYIAPMEMPS